MTVHYIEIMPGMDKRDILWTNKGTTQNLPGLNFTITKLDYGIF